MTALVILLTVQAAQALQTPPDRPISDYSGRSALVIGNANYLSVGSLQNPLNDARAITASLRDLGFNVTLLENATLQKMVEAIRSIKEDFERDGIGLFYYAGHAVHFSGINYLLPVDIVIETPGDLEIRAVPVNGILVEMTNAGTDKNIVILDACHNNPFEGIRDTLGHGLAIVERGAGETFIAYAAAEGEAAADGDGVNSPYTAALVSSLEVPGHSIFDIFVDVRRRVKEATHGQQIPWVSASLDEAIIFRSVDDAAPAPTATDGGVVNVASVFWDAIQGSTDRQDFATFLKHYGDSPYADPARERLEVLADQSLDLRPDVPELREVDTPQALGADVNLCDIVGSDPDDPNRITDGVRWGILNTRLAVRACAADLAVDRANPRLLFQLARALDIGGKPKQAEALYKQAIGLGYSAAMTNLGFMYTRGRGVERDENRGIALYRRAALLGNQRARTNMGTAFERGSGDLETNHEEAIRWYRLAADNGWPNAIDSLGNMYRFGRGVEQDSEEAARYYRLAAMLGHSNAMNNLGKLYREGQGVPKDYGESVRWFERATGDGNQYSPYNLGFMFRSGWGVDKDPLRAIVLLQLAADRGFAKARIQLGEMFEAGEGVNVDLLEAYFHYFVAAESGDKDAPERLAALDKKMPPGARSAAEARAESWIRQNGG